SALDASYQERSSIREVKLCASHIASQLNICLLIRGRCAARSKGLAFRRWSTHATMRLVTSSLRKERAASLTKGLDILAGKGGRGERRRLRRSLRTWAARAGAEKAKANMVRRICGTKKNRTLRMGF
ncbi:hypothetical protein TrRE_jg4580, partial [Triparma retinervis]